MKILLLLSLAASSLAGVSRNEVTCDICVDIITDIGKQNINLLDCVAQNSSSSGSQKSISALRPEEY